MLDFKTHFILNEGGVAGHMSHIYENISLTGNQLKAIFKDLIQGKKENITEKVDGQNIHFTWDEISHTVRFARNKTDFKGSGMSLEGITNKFKNYPESVKAAFVDGGTIIQNTILELSPELRTEIFGKRGSLWINAEIMHTQNPNLIQYSGNYIVLHGMVSSDDQPALSENFKILTKYLDKQTASQSQRAWSVVGPRLIKIQNYNSLQGPYGEFCSVIDNIFKHTGLSTTNTISDFIETEVIKELTDIKMPHDAAEAIAESIVDKRKINVAALKKQYGTTFASYVTEYGTQTNKSKIRGRIVKPFQEAITDLSVEVLKTLTSFFVNNHTQEVERIRKELRNAIEVIENTRDEHSTARLNFLKSQMSTLKKVENFCSTIEGIVFEEPAGSGQLYKITGSFAPVNQILGLMSYGRGAIPPISK